MDMTYKQVGDYILPNLVMNEQENFKIGKYGMIRLQFLKDHRKGTYQKMLMRGTLQKHLQEIETEAQDMKNNLVTEIAKKLEITEELKAQDQMKWVGMMNNIANQAEEIVMNEIIFL